MRTARGGSDGCTASVQSYDGSIIVCNRYDDNDVLRVKVGTSNNSSCYIEDHLNCFDGTFSEFKDALKLLRDIKDGKVSVVRHRTPKTK